MQTLVFATCKFNAKDAQSQYEPQFSTVVAMDDGTEQRIYWKAGGTADHLRSGDVVAIEYSKGKWRLSKTQAPELLKKLEARRQQSALAAPAQPAPAQLAQTLRSIETDCDEMIRIYSHLRRSLAQAPDECIQAMACTIWIQRNNR